MKHEGHAPLDHATLVAYFAGDLPSDEEARLEDRLFACASCTAEAERVAAVTETIRSMIPPVVSPSRLAALRARGLRIDENHMQPEGRSTVEFPPDLDLLVHHLAMPALREARRADVRVHVESTGETIGVFEDVPVDREHGEVLIPCQIHFASLPPDILFEVRAESHAGTTETARYAVMHHMHPRPGLRLARPGEG